MDHIQAKTRESSLYYIDEWQAYATLRLRGDHVIIRKEKGCPQGRDHINGIEGLELGEKLSLSLPWCAPQKVPSLPGGSLLPL